MNIQDITSAMIAETGINPTRIYCQVTGRSIGRIDEDEFALILSQIGECDLDDLISELWTRTVASMRPSPAWNKYVGKESLAIMLDRDPRGLLCYLMNRMYKPAQKGNQPLPVEDELRFTANRITVANRIMQQEIDSPMLHQILLQLLEMDSLYGLKSIATLVPVKINVADLLPDFNEEYLDSLIAHKNAISEAHAKAIRKAQSEARFTSERNYLTGKAYTKQFVKVTPPSPKKVAASAKAADIDFLSGVFDDLMGGDLIDHSSLYHPVSASHKSQFNRVVTPKTTTKPANSLAGRKLTFGGKAAS
jgi:hypothetical protein